MERVTGNCFAVGGGLHRHDHRSTPCAAMRTLTRNSARSVRRSLRLVSSFLNTRQSGICDLIHQRLVPTTGGLHGMVLNVSQSASKSVPAISVTSGALDRVREATAVAALVDGFLEHVQPRIESGVLPVNECFGMAAMGVEVLRRLGVQARAVPVDVDFLDRTNGFHGTTDWSWAESHPEEWTCDADADHGHAVIVTSHHLVDLTFRQFDPHGVAPTTFTLPLEQGWGGFVGFDAGSWDVEFTDRRWSAGIELAKQAIAVGLYAKECALIVGEAAQLRRKVGRNDPCACGSDQKFKRCCGAHAARLAAQ